MKRYQREIIRAAVSLIILIASLAAMPGCTGTGNLTPQQAQALAAGAASAAILATSTYAGIAGSKSKLSPAQVQTINTAAATAAQIAASTYSAFASPTPTPTPASP